MEVKECLEKLEKVKTEIGKQMGAFQRPLFDIIKKANLELAKLKVFRLNAESEIDNLQDRLQPLVELAKVGRDYRGGLIEKIIKMQIRSGDIPDNEIGRSSVFDVLKTEPAKYLQGLLNKLEEKSAEEKSKIKTRTEMN